MIEKALYGHLIGQSDLAKLLTKYDSKPAVFNQEAPADTDELWAAGPQYGRIVFIEDLKGDPARIMGGSLAVDIMCKKDEQSPEEIEPIVKRLIHGYFFSNGKFTVAAQWRNSAYFKEANDSVTGCTLTFDLLGFPVLTTIKPDVIKRINEWTHARFSDLHVINLTPLPDTAWKPSDGSSAIYWRLMQDGPGMIPDTYAAIHRKATLKAHIFSADLTTSSSISREIIVQLYLDKWLRKEGEVSMRVDHKNTLEDGADPLKTGQVTVEVTYGIMRYQGPSAGPVGDINFNYAFN